MADIYSVRSMATNKVVQSGFDKKQDAKAVRNELCKEAWGQMVSKDRRKERA